MAGGLPPIMPPGMGGGASIAPKDNQFTDSLDNPAYNRIMRLAAQQGANTFSPGQIQQIKQHMDHYAQPGNQFDPALIADLKDTKNWTHGNDLPKNPFLEKMHKQIVAELATKLEAIQPLQDNIKEKQQAIQAFKQANKSGKEAILDQAWADANPNARPLPARPPSFEQDYVKGLQKELFHDVAQLNKIAKSALYDINRGQKGNSYFQQFEQIAALQKQLRHLEIASEAILQGKLDEKAAAKAQKDHAKVNAQEDPRVTQMDGNDEGGTCRFWIPKGSNIEVGYRGWKELSVKLEDGKPPEAVRFNRAERRLLMAEFEKNTGTKITEKLNGNNYTLTFETKSRREEYMQFITEKYKEKRTKQINNTNITAQPANGPPPLVRPGGQ